MTWVRVGDQARFAGDRPSAEDARTGFHYVSIISRGRLCLALGPFESHHEAGKYVDRVRAFVRPRSRNSWTFAYGTCRLDEREDAPLGRLNGELGISLGKVGAK